MDNWSSLLKQLYLKQSSPTFPNKEHFIFPSLLLLKDGWELLEGREMHCSSFIFQVHSKRPAVSVRKYILKEWLFKSLKVRLLSSLPSSVYHLSLGWEKMEDKKLCCQSNYLSDQPGTTSILAARITGLRKQFLINHLISKVTLDWTARIYSSKNLPLIHCGPHQKTLN